MSNAILKDWMVKDMPILGTQRLILREFLFDDAAEVFACYLRNR